MDKETLKTKLKELQEQFKIDEKNIIREFAFSNNPYKIGDIVTDHIGSIKIEKIKYSYSANFDELPQCVYYGIELNKNGKPSKKQNHTAVWQCNIKSEAK